MKLKYNVNGDARKKLVGAISEILNTPMQYKGASTFAYEVGGYTIDREGTVTGSRNPELLNALFKAGFDAETAVLEGIDDSVELEELAAKTAAPKRKGIMDIIVDELNANAEDDEHWERKHITPTMECGDGKWRNLNGTFARVTNNHGGEYDADGKYIKGIGETFCSPEDGMQTSDVPDTITIEIPFTGNEDILRSLLQSKATLITAALGEDAYWYCPEDEYSPENPGGWYGPATSDNALPIEFTDGTVKFEWLRFGTDSEVIKAWSAFLCATVEFAKSAKRVTAKDKAVESEKFAFRTFMTKIEMNGAEYRDWRRLLMRNLKGDAAFATKASKEKWLAKHGSKKAEVTSGE